MRSRILLSALAGLCAGVAVPSIAGAELLQELAAGKWELRERGSDAVTTICMGNRSRLIQLRHPGLSCEWMVLDRSADVLTVQYTCPRHGYGRTQIRRETNQLIQMETQGIADGLPYQQRLEGRRVGACPV